VGGGNKKSNNKMKVFDSRSFRSAVPTVWNNLPHHLRQGDISRGQFASGLKHGCSVVHTSRMALLIILIVAVP